MNNCCRMCELIGGNCDAQKMPISSWRLFAPRIGIGSQSEEVVNIQEIEKMCDRLQRSTHPAALKRGAGYKRREWVSEEKCPGR